MKEELSIEKEALAVTWACEKFSYFILSKHIEIETDHKTLVPLLGTKHLDNLPPRVLRFRLRLDRFSYTIQHVPGKQLYTADTLSRAPVTRTTSDDSTTLQELAELCMLDTIAHLPVSTQRLDTYRRAQSEDPVYTLLCKYCQEGWPNKKAIDPRARPYWEAQGELTVGNGILLYRSRIVVPKALQAKTLKKLHGGHQGIVRCRLRARTAVWWPGLSQQIADLLKKCPECTWDNPPHKEPLIPTPLPDYPWQKVATDLFILKGDTYIVVTDYFSRYPEIIQLKSTTTQSVVTALKSVFSRHGIPETVVSDNGPQFSSQEFSDFASNYQFAHVTSSPHYPASNGQAKCAVKTAKQMQMIPF